MAATVHILIPAAGASRRMRGQDKLVLDAGGQPLLRRVASVALSTGAPVTVTLPPNDTARRRTLAGLPLRIVEVPDADQGMSRSIAAGTAAILATSPDHTDGLMILPADMPDFTASALAGLIADFRNDPGSIRRACTSDGRPGHPVVFPRRVWPALLSLTGDEGGRPLLQDHKDSLHLVPLPGEMAVTDLDCPEDWQAWRGRNP